MLSPELTLHLQNIDVNVRSVLLSFWQIKIKLFSDRKLCKISAVMLFMPRHKILIKPVKLGSFLFRLTWRRNHTHIGSNDRRCPGLPSCSLSLTQKMSPRLLRLRLDTGTLCCWIHSNSRYYPTLQPDSFSYRRLPARTSVKSYNS